VNFINIASKTAFDWFKITIHFVVNRWKPLFGVSISLKRFLSPGIVKIYLLISPL